MPETTPSSPCEATADTPRPPFFSQPDLMPLEDMQLQAPPAVEAKGNHYTGAWLRQNNPQKYARVVRLLGEGASYHSIVDITGCNHYLVTAIEAHEWPTIEQQRKHTIQRLRRVATMGVERIVEMLDATDQSKVTLRDLGYVVDISTKTAELLAGGVTERREIVRAPAPAADQVLDDYLKGLPTVEVEETGSPAPETLPARATLPAPAPFTWPTDRSSPDAVPASTIDRATDSESDGKAQIAEDSGHI